MTSQHPSPAQHRALEAAAEGHLHCSGSWMCIWVGCRTVTVTQPTVRCLTGNGWVVLPDAPGAMTAPGRTPVLLTQAGRAALELCQRAEAGQADTA